MERKSKKQGIYIYISHTHVLWFSFEVVSDSATLRTIASQAPLSMGFSRREYWSGLPCPSPRDLPNPGTKPVSLALAGGFFTTELPGKPQSYKSLMA